MNEWVNITQQNWAFWVAGTFALFEFFKWAYTGIEWLGKTFGIETKGMRNRRECREENKRIKADIAEIKETSKYNVAMFIEHEHQVVAKFMDIKDEIVEELNKLHEKLDEHQEEIEKNNKDTIKTDCAILRDRLNSGMRYFSQNKDEEGHVHISPADYENMYALFQEYFKKGGNGAFKRMFEDEFLHFIIDR